MAARARAGQVRGQRTEIVRTWKQLGVILSGRTPVITHLSTPREGATPRASPDVNYGLWVTGMSI